MKLKTLLLLLLITFQSYSQVSVGARHIGKERKFKKGILEKFKNSETIFVLSNIYDKEIYEEILKDSWDVTPYKIVSYDDYNFNDYLNGNYTIVKLSGYKLIKQMKSGSEVTYLYTYVDFKLYEGSVISEKLAKLSEKKRKKQWKKTLDKNSYSLARFYVFPKDEFANTILNRGMDVIVNSFYSDDVLYNYKPGLLKNYFQKVNSLLKNEEVYWMYEEDYYLPELQNLTKKKLYIPSYMSISYNPWKIKDSDENAETIQELFKDYDFDYEMIPDEELSNKIMNNEEFYYARYVRMNTEKFLQVVNSKTGEIVYRNYIRGLLRYKMKAKDIRALNSKIKKAAKK